MRFLEQLIDATVEDAGSLLRSFCDTAAALSTGGYEKEEEDDDDEDEEDDDDDEEDDDDDDDHDEQEEAALPQPHQQHPEAYLPGKAAPAAAALSDGSAAMSAPASASKSGEISWTTSKVSIQGKGPSTRAAGELEAEEGAIDHGWEMVSEESLRADESENTEGSGGGKTVRSNTPAKGKVELGERERARTSDAKERLKAGIFSYDS